MEEDDNLLWTFGNLTEDVKILTIRFLKGLDNLGKELFDKGIASIKLSPIKSGSNKVISKFWGDELFIVNLEGSFFLIISDPNTTIKMINQMGGIPEEIDYQIRSVLVGQASIQYANIMSKIEKEEDMYFIDRLFQTPLDDVMTREEQKEKGVFVDKGSCSFSGLGSIECLIFHYLLREYFAEEYTLFIKNPWSMIQHQNGIPVILDFKPPKEKIIFASLLSLLNEYSKGLLESQLKSLVFGDSFEFTSIDIIHGKEHFMAVSSPIYLFLNKEFLGKFSAIDDQIKKSLSANLAKYLSKEISNDYLKNLEQKPLSELFRILGQPKV
jgi:hypothetical protein